MGTIADKLSYLNDTKTLLRRGINALGGGLTTDDTFRSYANALDNIYDYLPKVTGTGTSVTLDDVRDGGLRITLNPTAISQTTYTGSNKLDSSFTTKKEGLTHRPCGQGQPSTCNYILIIAYYLKK